MAKKSDTKNIAIILSTIGIIIAFVALIFSIQGLQNQRAYTTQSNASENYGGDDYGRGGSIGRSPQTSCLQSILPYNQNQQGLYCSLKIVCGLQNGNTDNLPLGITCTASSVDKKVVYCTTTACMEISAWQRIAAKVCGCVLNSKQCIPQDLRCVTPIPTPR